MTTSTTPATLMDVSTKELIEKLHAKKYYTDYDTAERIRMALTTQKGVCGARLVGPQGSGKTVLTEHIASILGRKYFYLQATRGMTEAELFFGIMPDTDTKSGFARFDGTLLEAVRTSKEQPVVICLDEWDKTRPTSDGFLLDFLQTGRISHPAVKLQAETKNLMVFICTNLDRELSEPLQRRLPVVDLGHPSVDVMLNILSQTMPDSPFVQHAVKIFAQTIKAGLAKPATAQELIQLLGALQMKEQPSVADLDTMLDVFVLKSESDRARFRSWYKNNSATTLQELAKTPSNTAQQVKYVAELKDEVYTPVQAQDASDTYSEPLRPKTLRKWEFSNPSKTSALGASVLITNKKIGVAMAHLPAIIKNPEAWAVCGKSVAVFEKFAGIDGIHRLSSLMLRPETSIVAALILPHPIAGRTFTISALAENADELHHFTRYEVWGVQTFANLKTSVCFRVTPASLELLFETSQPKIPVRQVLDSFLSVQFMRWYLGEQTSDAMLLSAHSYGVGAPALHGLYEIDTAKAPKDVVTEIKNKTMLWNQRIARSLET